MNLLLSIAMLAPLTGCASVSASQGDGLEDVYERVHGSVVTLRTSVADLASRRTDGRATFEGLGSGVLISTDGGILTAAHVVQAAERIEVEFYDGTRRPARVVSSNPRADVALLRLEGSPPSAVRPAALGESDRARIGGRVFVVGAPLGVVHTLTVGHLSARRASPDLLQGPVQIELLQTDAAINEGNSGGPMFDAGGNVIGIVSHIVSRSGGSQGLGFAVSIETVRKLLLDLPPFWSGVDGVVLTKELAAALNVPAGQAGLLVENVAKGSPGAAIGLRGGTMLATIDGQQVALGGDVVLSVLDVPIGAPDAYDKIARALAELGPTGTLRATVLRAGKTIELSGPVRRDG